MAPIVDQSIDLTLEVKTSLLATLMPLALLHSPMVPSIGCNHLLVTIPYRRG